MAVPAIKEKARNVFDGAAGVAGRASGAARELKRTVEDARKSEQELSIQRVIQILEQAVSITIATGKFETYIRFVNSLQEYLGDAVYEKVKLMDFELSAEELRQLEEAWTVSPHKSIDFPREHEPELPDAIKAVLFKLQRAAGLNLPDSTKDSEPENIVFAGDIVVRISDSEGNLVPRHKMIRTVDQLQRYRDMQEDEKVVYDSVLKKELFELYCNQDFTVVWDVAMGATRKGVHRASLLQIKADFPPLDENEVDNQYLPFANTGIGLLEIGQQRGVSFYVTNGAGNKIEIDSEIAKQLIVSKVPPMELMDMLLHIEITRDPSGMGTILRSALNLISKDSSQIDQEKDNTDFLKWAIIYAYSAREKVL